MKRETAKRGSSTHPKQLPPAGKIANQEPMVADEPPKAPVPFDVRTVEALVALMTQHDLCEIDLRDGAQRLRLRRGALAAAVPALAPMGTPAPSLTSAPAPFVKNQEAVAPVKKLVDIKSQTVGTFYAAPTPGADPFVKIGSTVSPASVVGLIEAMKLFNEINAECSGVIVEILVENQQPVEFGQVLMRVDPAG